MLLGIIRRTVLALAGLVLVWCASAYAPLIRPGASRRSMSAPTSS